MSDGNEYKTSTRRRRLLAVLVAGALVLGMGLAACGGGDDDDDDATGGADAGVPLAERDLSGELAMTTDFDYAGKPGGMQKYWDTLASAFEKETDVSVDAQLTPYPELASRMESQFQAQEGPELMAWYGNIHSFQFLDRGVLEPLNDWLPQEEIDSWYFAGEPLDGDFYMQPTYIELFLLVANKQKAEDAGIDLDERIPSWEEFVAGLERVKDNNGETPVVMGTKDQFGLEQWAIPMSMAYMDNPTEWASWVAGDVPYDTPSGSGWINQVGELFDKDLANEDAPELNAAEAVERFRDGEGAFMVMFSGEALTLDPDKFQIIPYWDGPGEASAPVAAAGSGLVMASYGENNEAAAAMLEFQHTPEMLDALYEQAGVLPNDRRFQPPDLDENPMLAQTYDLIEGEPKPHWPTEFMPQDVLFDGMYAIGPKVAAGTPAADVNGEMEAFLEDWRSSNPERLDMVHSLVGAAGG